MTLAPTPAATAVGAASRFTVPQILVHAFLLIAAQALYAWIYTRLPYLGQAVAIPLFFRLAVWTAPVLAWLYRRGENPLDYVGVSRGIGRGLAWGAAFGIALFALNVIGARVTAGAWNISFDIGMSHWVNGVALVGLSEEVVFRGFYLNALCGRLSFARANLLQAGLFLAIHLPGWWLLGQFHWPAVGRLIVTITLFGLFNGWLFRRTRSLWACMLFHSFNNLASFVVR